MNQTELGYYAGQAYDKLGWYGGINHWQYSSDNTGNSISKAAGTLIDKCKGSQKCN